MGPPEHKPADPKFEFTQQPETHRGASKVIEECNWLQAMEGGLDSVHSSFLHRKLAAGDGLGFDGLRADAVAGRLDVETEEYGYRYAAHRPIPGRDENYVRSYHFVMPHVQIRAAQLNNDGSWFKFKIAGHHWVPIDDNTTLVWNWFYSLDTELTQDEIEERGFGNGPTDIDQATFRARGTMRNDWMIDRAKQRVASFTGIDGVNAQDRAVQEAMGAIVNRSKEHLGQTDKAIIMLRKILLNAMRTVADGGDAPGANDSYYNLRGIEEVLPEDAKGLEVLADKMFARVG
jgi:hypothetical protein